MLFVSVDVVHPAHLGGPVPQAEGQPNMNTIVISYLNIMIVPIMIIIIISSSIARGRPGGS